MYFRARLAGKDGQFIVESQDSHGNYWPLLRGSDLAGALTPVILLAPWLGHQVVIIHEGQECLCTRIVFLKRFSDILAGKTPMFWPSHPPQCTI